MRQRNGARELGLIVAALAVTVHFLEPTPAILVGALAGFITTAGLARLIGGGWVPWRQPRFPLALPVLAAFAIAGLARFAGSSLWLVALLPAGWLVLAWIVDLELYGFFKVPVGAAPAEEATRRVRRIRTRRRPESELPQLVVEETEVELETPPHPRALAIRSAALALSFLGFVAAAGFIPGAFGAPGQGLPGRDLLALVAVDAVIAGVAGYRISALVASSAIDRMVRVLAMLEYAVPIGFAAWAFRAMALPRLFVPALLTLGVYMITIMRESPEPVVMNRRLLRELGILTLAAAATVAWGLMVK
jgi:hypothetical protein